MDEYFIGVDPSLTGFAVVTLNQLGAVVRQDSWETSPGQFTCFSARINYLRESFCRLLDSFTAGVHVAIEGYSFGSRNGRELAGGLGELIRWTLWQRKIGFLEVPPTTLKSFACGVGGAKKEVVLREVFRRWGYVARDNNLADAYALARLLWERTFPEFQTAHSCAVLAKLAAQPGAKMRKPPEAPSREPSGATGSSACPLDSHPRS